MRLDGERLVEISPRARTFTCRPLCASPCATSAAGSTSPLSKYFASVSTFTTAYSTRLGLVNPCSFGHAAAAAASARPRSPGFGSVRAPVALRAAAGGLAARAGAAAADARAVLLRALGGLQVMQLHPSTSSTVTRCWTLDHPADLRAVVLDDGVVDAVQAEPADRVPSDPSGGGSRCATWVTLSLPSSASTHADPARPAWPP